jgi:glycosyltransferase involved in cell wall biosynthesis
MGITETVTFGGTVSGQARLDAYAAADIYAQASEAEGSSMSLLEAASLGLPVVVTRECEFPAEEYGLGMVAEGSPELFAKALARVAEQKRAGALPSQQGLMKFRANHSWRRITEQFEALYREAIAAATASSA